MSVTASHMDTQQPPLLFNARPRSSIHDSPTSTPLPVSPSSSTSPSASGNSSTSSSSPSTSHADVETGQIVTPHEPLGQNHERETGADRVEEVVVAQPEAVAVIQERPSANEERGDSQQQIASSQATNAEAVDTAPDATQHSSSEENAAFSGTAELADEQSTITSAEPSQAQASGDGNTSDLQNTDPGASGIPHGSNPTTATEPVRVGEGGEASEAVPADTTEQDTTAARQRETGGTADEGGADDESDSSADEDDDWRRSLYSREEEDTSLPDAEELKEITEAGEASADDESHWKAKALKYFEDPEYTPGPSGCLHWLLEGYHGPKDKPNKALTMRSPTALIGGYEWQIKFYPRGNDTEYLSIYVECVNMMSKDKALNLSADDEDTADLSKERGKAAEDTDVAEDTQDESIKKDATPAKQPVGAPIPYLQDACFSSPPSVVALVTLILYNPEEPRVNYHRIIAHRFSPGSPDWGWTRFHGPRREIHKRQRGQRQALLRNDKLAFKTYIQLINDPTGCLGQHSSNDDPWDSLAMTGIRSLTLKGYELKPNDSHFVCAVTSWLLLKPFRQLLYSVEISDPNERPREKPKPFITSLLEMLYRWRMPSKHRKRCISLGSVKRAIMWHGMGSSMHEEDPVSVWVTFRVVMELEMCGYISSSSSSSSPPPSPPPPAMKRIASLLGRCRNLAPDSSSYRIPVLGVQSIQNGIDVSQKFLRQEDPLPELLPVELERHVFDKTSRAWKKVVDKVSIQEEIRVRDTSYVLYGMIVHRGILISGQYQAILRPQGPGGKWYSFTSDDDGGKVTCLTRKEAITAHEGLPIVADDANADAKVDETLAVAYLVMYIRNDVALEAFDTEKEVWDVPNWLVDRIEPDGCKKSNDDDEDNDDDDDVTSDDGGVAVSANPSESKESTDTLTKEGSVKKPTVETARDLEVQIIDSRMFLTHKGYGNFDPTDPRLGTTTAALGTKENSSPYVHKIMLKSTATVGEITERLVEVIEDVKCTRQCRVWAMNSFSEAVNRAKFIDPEHALRSEYLSERTERRFWVHVTPLEDLPPLPSACGKSKDSYGEGRSRESTQEERDGREPQATTVEVSVAADLSGEVLGASDESHGQAEEFARQGPNSVVDTVIGGMNETNASRSVQANEASAAGSTSVNALAGEATGLFVVPLRDADANLSGETGSPVVSTSTLELAAIADSLNNNDDASSQTLSSNDNANRTSAADQAHEDVLTSQPSGHEDDARSSSSNQIHDNAEQNQSDSSDEEPDDTYVFLKIFDQEAQKLTPWGSFLTPLSSRIGEVVRVKLNLPNCENISVWRERKRSSALELDPHHTFADEDMETGGHILVYCKVLLEEQVSALTARAAYSNFDDYLGQIMFHETTPQFAGGLVTLDGFAAPFQTGMSRNGSWHGRGHSVSLSGTQYTGEFQMNQRHGLGRMIYPNGDEYNGNWAKGMRDGQGRFVEAATGNTYVGGWRKDRQYGEGVTTWKAADVSERLCRICWDASADTAMYDCGHVVACLECARRVETCPVCRKKVVSAMKLFYVT